ncbi:MAG: proline racemase family protein [Acidobacteriota bacterium]
MRSLKVIDSHTEGEPTRVVVAGAPDLDASLPAERRGDAAARAAAFRERHDSFRTAVVLEPRGFDALVGALLLEPADPRCAAQMIFFNNAGTLHMCGHGTLGVVATLAHLGRLGPGRHALETPVGEVQAELHRDGSVSVDSVFSYRYRSAVEVKTERHGALRGDIAWGGNWFFLIEEHGLELSLGHLEALLDLTRDVRRSLERQGILGRDGGVIDHVELFAPPSRRDCDSRNFVLCPGDEYDRCPCGTGTSAKMACLAADGALGEGETWRQEGILGSRFTGSIRRATDEGGVRGVMPTLRGRAFVTAESTLLFDPADPFANGIRR